MKSDDKNFDDAHVFKLFVDSDVFVKQDGENYTISPTAIDVFEIILDVLSRSKASYYEKQGREVLFMDSMILFAQIVFHDPREVVEISVMFARALLKFTDFGEKNKLNINDVALVLQEKIKNNMK